MAPPLPSLSTTSRLLGVVFLIFCIICLFRSSQDASGSDDEYSLDRSLDVPRVSTVFSRVQTIRYKDLEEIVNKAKSPTCNCVTLTLVDSRCFFLFSTWYTQFLKHNHADNLLVGALDYNAHRFFLDNGIPSYELFPGLNSTSDLSRGDVWFTRMYLVSAILEMGVNVLQCDLDAVWYRDPLPLYHGKYDLVFSAGTARWDWVACMGWAYWRASPQMNALYARMFHLYQTIPDDQRAITFLLLTMGSFNSTDADLTLDMTTYGVEGLVNEYGLSVRILPWHLVERFCEEPRRYEPDYAPYVKHCRLLKGLGACPREAFTPLEITDTYRYLITNAPGVEFVQNPALHEWLQTVTGCTPDCSERDPDDTDDSVCQVMGCNSTVSFTKVYRLQSNHGAPNIRPIIIHRHPIERLYDEYNTVADVIYANKTYSCVTRIGASFIPGPVCTLIRRRQLPFVDYACHDQIRNRVKTQASSTGDTLMAIKNKFLVRYSIVGVHERMNETLELMCGTFGLNNTEHIRSLVPPEIMKPQYPAAAALSAEDYQRIAECNADDMELYQFANDMLTKKLVILRYDPTRLSLKIPPELEAKRRRI